MQRYFSFCQQFNVKCQFPLTGATLCRFVAFLGQQNLKHRTIKSLSGLCFAQINQGLGNPFREDTPRLDYVLTGIKLEEARKGSVTRPRLLITIDVLRKLKQVWLAPPVTFDDKMLWAAACTGFFGFIRAGEFTVPSSQAYDPDVHLSLGDLAIDSHNAPSLIHLAIKQSKTDHFRQRVDIFIGSTNWPVCPVKALIEYLWATEGALFLFESGAPLIRASLVARLQQALQRGGLNPSDFKGHSFRIRAAITSAKKDWKTHLFKPWAIGKVPPTRYTSSYRGPS